MSKVNNNVVDFEDDSKESKGFRSHTCFGQLIWISSLLKQIRSIFIFTTENSPTFQLFLRSFLIFRPFSLQIFSHLLNLCILLVMILYASRPLNKPNFKIQRLLFCSYVACACWVVGSFDIMCAFIQVDAQTRCTSAMTFRMVCLQRCPKLESAVMTWWVFNISNVLVIDKLVIPWRTLHNASHSKGPLAFILVDLDELSRVPIY